MKLADLESRPNVTAQSKDYEWKIPVVNCFDDKGAEIEGCGQYTCAIGTTSYGKKFAISAKKSRPIGLAADQHCVHKCQCKMFFNKYRGPAGQWEHVPCTQNGRSYRATDFYVWDTYAKTHDNEVSDAVCCSYEDEDNGLCSARS